VRGLSDTVRGGVCVAVEGVGEETIWVKAKCISLGVEVAILRAARSKHLNFTFRHDQIR